MRLTFSLTHDVCDVPRRIADVLASLSHLIPADKSAAVFVELEIDAEPVAAQVADTPPPPAAPAPDTPPPPSISREDLLDLMRSAALKHPRKGDAVREVLGEFGGTRITDVAETDWPAIAERMREFLR
jgi:hypothetical protein